jgi:rod shape-determining protein MreD
MNKPISLLIWFLALVFAQVFMLDPIMLRIPYTPLIYVLLFVLIPQQWESWLVILIGFFVGLTVDLLFLSGGIHSLSSLIACLTRPLLMRAAYRDTISFRDLNIENESFGSLCLYTLLIILVHHFFLFTAMAGSWSKFGWLLGAWGANSILTIMSCFLLLVLTQKTK